MGFNIGFSILSTIPYVGAMTDIGWAAWSNSAAGPISSPQQLANDLIDEINIKINKTSRRNSVTT